MDLKPRQISVRKCGMIDLVYSGDIVFKKIIPFLTEYEDWLYWRKNKFNEARLIATIFKYNGHLTKSGLKLIVLLLYSKPNKYLKPKEYWLSLIDKRLWK